MAIARAAAIREMGGAVCARQTTYIATRMLATDIATTFAPTLGQYMLAGGICTRRLLPRRMGMLFGVMTNGTV